MTIFRSILWMEILGIFVLGGVALGSKVQGRTVSCNAIRLVLLIVVRRRSPATAIVTMRHRATPCGNCRQQPIAIDRNR